MVNLSNEWRDYLWDIYLKGEVVQKDDGDKIREIVGVHKYLHKPHSLFLDNIPFNIESPEKFLDLVAKGVYNIDNYPLKDQALHDYVNAWNLDEQIYLGDDSFVYTYPERISNMLVYDKYTDSSARINQYDVILERLYEHSGSNRAVATLYNAGLDRNEQHIPCLNFLQALIRKNKLILCCMFRSNDIFNAWPSNMLLLTHLGLKLANDLKTTFEGIDYHCTSAHYYLTEEPIIKNTYKW